MEIIFYSHANKTHLHKKGCAPSLILKVRVFGTRKWPIWPRRVCAAEQGMVFRVIQCYQVFFGIGSEDWRCAVYMRGTNNIFSKTSNIFMLI